MTMINSPPHTHHSITEQNRCGGGYVGLMGRLEEAGRGYEFCSLKSGLFIGPMAEDDSRTESVNEEGSSSKGAVVVQQDEEMMRGDQGWLQLGIGQYHPIGGPSSQDRAQPTRSANQQQTGLVELDLLAGGGGLGLEQVTTSAATAATGVVHLHPNVQSSFGWQYPGGIGNNNSSLGFPLHEKINYTNWGLIRPQILSQNMIMPFPATAASTSAFLMPGGTTSYLNRDGVGSSSSFSVIDPPRRPHSGLWFLLQVSQNQSKEPFLPQIPKSYLRIKDGRMTVRLLMKYLVNKLKLDSESEIEIRCKGQQLLPFLTLQHVRDHIWRSSSDATTITLLPDSSTSDHVMVLNYARNP